MYDKNTKMNKETLRMQMLAGIITESQYKAKLEEINRFEKSTPEDNQAAQAFASWAKSQGQNQGDFSFGDKYTIQSSLKKLFDTGLLTKDLVNTWKSTEPTLFRGLQVQLNRANMELNLPGERSYKNVTDRDIKNASPEEIAQAIDILLSRKDFDLIKRIQALRPDVMNEESKKDSLNEHYVAGGIVGIGAINQIPSRAKADYEDAFEHFLGQKYSLNEMEKEVEEGKEVEEPSLYEAEVNENVGATIEKILQSFEFSEKGNDEMVEFANYLLSPEGPKNIAMSIKSRLKGEGGENYFTSTPDELDALLSKLK